jgi:hypothetical protein
MPLLSAVIAAAFSLAVGSLIPAIPAMFVSGAVNFSAAVTARLPRRHETQAHAAAVFYAVFGTFGYTAMTVVAMSRL